MDNEPMMWLNEVLQVFPTLNRKTILVDYKKVKSKKLGYVTAKIEQKLDFDPEALLLGEQTDIKKRIRDRNQITGNLHSCLHWYEGMNNDLHWYIHWFLDSPNTSPI